MSILLECETSSAFISLTHTSFGSLGNPKASKGKRGRVGLLNSL